MMYRGKPIEAGKKTDLLRRSSDAFGRYWLHETGAGSPQRNCTDCGESRVRRSVKRLDASHGAVVGKHREISVQIEDMCKPVRQKATAHWNDSTEGRLCAAAHDLAFFRSAPVTGDGKTFRPGTH
jgi:hypothetical protein